MAPASFEVVEEGKQTKEDHMVEILKKCNATIINFADAIFDSSEASSSAKMKSASSKRSSVSALCHQATHNTFSPSPQFILQEALKDKSKVLVIYDAEALINTVEGDFENSQGFFKKSCMRNLRDLLEEEEQNYAIGSFSNLLPVFEMILSCMPSFH